MDPPTSPTAEKDDSHKNDDRNLDGSGDWAAPEQTPAFAQPTLNIMADEAFDDPEAAQEFAKIRDSVISDLRGMTDVDLQRVHQRSQHLQGVQDALKFIHHEMQSRGLQEENVLPGAPNDSGLRQDAAATVSSSDESDGTIRPSRANAQSSSSSSIPSWKRWSAWLPLPHRAHSIEPTAIASIKASKRTRNSPIDKRRIEKPDDDDDDNDLGFDTLFTPSSLQSAPGSMAQVASAKGDLHQSGTDSCATATGRRWALALLAVVVGGALLSFVRLYMPFSASNHIPQGLYDAMGMSTACLSPFEDSKINDSFPAAFRMQQANATFHAYLHIAGHTPQSSEQLLAPALHALGHRFDITTAGILELLSLNDLQTVFGGSGRVSSPTRAEVLIAQDYLDSLLAQLGDLTFMVVERVQWGATSSVQSEWTCLMATLQHLHAAGDGVHLMVSQAWSVVEDHHSSAS